MQDGSRRRARLILIVGVALALVAGVGTFVYASGAKSDQPVAVPTVAVLVAAREIPAKTTLTTADVKLQEFNLDAKPAAAMSNAGEALGKRRADIAEQVLGPEASRFRRHARELHRRRRRTRGELAELPRYVDHGA